MSFFLKTKHFGNNCELNFLVVNLLTINKFIVLEIKFEINVCN